MDKFLSYNKFLKKKKAPLLEKEKFAVISGGRELKIIPLLRVIPPQVLGCLVNGTGQRKAPSKSLFI